MMPTIFLIGYMGCGKTTLGSVLAAVMNVPFVDLDDYIEERYEARITTIFKEIGEAGFRQLEKQALHEVARLGGIVACGGGTPCIEGNMELMNEMGLTIWLTTSAERIAARLCLPEQKAKRPLIAEKTDEEILEFVKEKLAEREPFYSKAQLRFDSTNIETATDTLETANLLAGILSILDRDKTVQWKKQGGNDYSLLRN